MVLCQCYYLKKSSTKEILVDGIQTWNKDFGVFISNSVQKLTFSSLHELKRT